MNVEGDSFGAGVVAHLSRKELEEQVEDLHEKEGDFGEKGQQDGGKEVYSVEGQYTSLDNKTAKEGSHQSYDNLLFNGSGEDSTTF